MGYSQLTKACRDCIYVNVCDHKEIEALAALPVSNMINSNNGAVSMSLGVSGSNTIELKDLTAHVEIGSIEYLNLFMHQQSINAYRKMEEKK